MGIESLTVNLSGGAANTDPAASTGGVRSSTAILFQSATVTSAIPGVTVTNAAGNALGTGTLAYSYVGKTITWTPPGNSVPGTAVTINANGTYLIRGAGVTNGYVIITVVSASLSSGTNYSTAVAIADQTALFLPAVAKDTAYTGATEYFLYYLNNVGATTIKAVNIQVQVDTPGLDTLSVAVIATKNTTELQAAASAHTYSAVGVDVAMGDLLTTDYWGFWIKRVTPALTVDGVTNNTFKLRVTALT